MTAEVQPHQEQLFETDQTVEDPQWKLDDDTRRIGREGLAHVRDELERHPDPTEDRKRRNRRRPKPERSTISRAYVAKGYRNAA